MWIILGIIVSIAESIRRDHSNFWLLLIIIGVIMLICNPLFGILFILAIALLFGLVMLIINIICDPDSTKKRITQSFLYQHRLKCYIILLCAILLIAPPIYLYHSDDTLAKEFRYNRAITLMNQGKYEKAEDLFASLKNVISDGSYKDSYDLYWQCSKKDYQQQQAYKTALGYIEEGNYTQAEAAFLALGQYEDSAERAERCTKIIEEAYSKVLVKMNNEHYAAAREILLTIQGYQDTAELLLICENKIADEKYGEQYEQAVTHMDAGRYSEAITLFMETKAYRDSEQKAVEAAVAMFENGTPEDSIEAYTLLGTLGRKEFSNASVLMEELLPRFKIARIKVANVGDTVVMGKTNCRWLVIAKEDDRILVISDESVSARAYHTEVGAISWANCSLRTWLNQDYFEKTFTADEASMIMETEIADGDEYSPSSTVVKDRIFLLSPEDAERFMPIIGGQSDSEAQTFHNAWWLRTAETSQETYVMNVLGEVTTLNGAATRADIGVRPAMWLSIE